MFITRLLSSIVYIGILIGVTYIGGPVLSLFLFLISLIGEFELYRLYKLEKTSIAITSYIISLIYYILILYKLINPIIIALLILVLLSVYTVSFSRYSIENITIIVLGFIYVAVCLSSYYLLRTMDSGMTYCWLVLIIAHGSDVSAYCVGMIFGKHKIIPRLSPKKSIEGCVGGIAGSVLFCLLFIKLFSPGCDTSSMIDALIITAIGACFSQLGDWTASAFKRQTGIKDFGNLIPGHGGILDRFDSLIFVSVFIYVILFIFKELMTL